MAQKKGSQEVKAETHLSVSEDQLITELIEKRRLQQEALIKIMTSIDKPDSEPSEVPAPIKIQKKLSAKKIFKIRKKSSQ